MSQLALVNEALSKHTIQANPIPQPPAGFVQVRIHAAAVNPLDYKLFDRDLGFLTHYPTVLGVDAAGEVTKLGPGVTDYQIGDRVCFVASSNTTVPGAIGDYYGHGQQGGFQQYAFKLAAVNKTTKIPDSASLDEAASWPVAGNTAAGALYGQLKFKDPWLPGGEGAHKGEKIVVLGGSSSVGQYVIQLAALSGLEVTTTSSPTHFAHLKSLGATHTLDRSSSTAEILSAAGPVKYIVDAISIPSTQLFALDLLSEGGKLVLVLAASPAAKESAAQKGVVLLGTVGREGFYYEWALPCMVAIKCVFLRGSIKFNRTTVIPGGLRGWEAAFDMHRKGTVSGTKLILRPLETDGQ
ncbi:GroES-like protein [Mycena amicta]|nr:GroES-like protein [Mycena amicta]